MIRIKASYSNMRELEKMVKVLKPYIASYTVKPQKGKYKRVYIDIDVDKWYNIPTYSKESSHEVAGFYDLATFFYSYYGLYAKASHKLNIGMCNWCATKIKSSAFYILPFLLYIMKGALNGNWFNYSI